MKAISTLVLFTITLCSFAQSPKTDAEKLVGKWVCHDDGYPMEADFKANGTGVVDGDVVGWSVKNNVLQVVVDGDRKNYTIAFTEGAFRVSGGDLERPMNFKRVTAGNNASNAASTGQNTTGKKLD